RTRPAPTPRTPPKSPQKPRMQDHDASLHLQPAAILTIAASRAMWVCAHYFVVCAEDLAMRDRLRNPRKRAREGDASRTRLDSRALSFARAPHFSAVFGATTRVACDVGGRRKHSSSLMEPSERDARFCHGRWRDGSLCAMGR